MSSVSPNALIATSKSAHMVHVWHVTTFDEHFSRRGLEALLAPDECERATRCASVAACRRFIGGRLARRLVLSRYVSCAPTDLCFANRPQGKPEIVAPAGAADFQFSVAHAPGLVLIAVARKFALGVDVERLQPVPDADLIAKHFFSAAERRLFQNSAKAERDLAFLRCWTRKEAVAKAMGVGVSLDLPHLDTARACVAGWSVHDLLVDVAYVGAIATPISADALRLRHIHCDLTELRMAAARCGYNEPRLSLGDVEQGCKHE
jgi:4'-phosphopantetheinyl transferase